MELLPQSSSRGPTPRGRQAQTPHERPQGKRRTNEAHRGADSRRAPASSSKSAHASANDGVCSPATDHQTPARPKSRYIPALDGLRTLAVVAVVLYHLNLTWAQGGLLGVTIFFVLSGYLITRLLLNEVAKTGHIDLKSFWIRRIRRLFPAVVTVVVVTCALCTIFNHVMLTKMRPDILPSLLFFNNWWQIAQDVSYFNALGDPSPLTHFWSLAIEEQFYLIWPPLLFAMVSMHVSKPNTRRVVLGLAAVSALAMMVLYNPTADPSRVYYGTDTRVFSLLLGAWMAFIPDRDLAPVRLAHRLGLDRLASAAKRGKLDKNAKDGHGEKTDSAAETAPAQPSALARFWSSPASIDVLGVVGLVGLAAMVALTNGYTAFQYRGGTLLCSILTLMVIAACVQPQSLVARALVRRAARVGRQALVQYLSVALSAAAAYEPGRQHQRYALVAVHLAGTCGGRRGRVLLIALSRLRLGKAPLGAPFPSSATEPPRPPSWVRAHIPVCASLRRRADHCPRRPHLCAGDLRVKW